MKKQPPMTDEERDLFRESMKGVKPLLHQPIPAVMPEPKKRFKRLSIRQPEIEIERLSEADTPTVQSDESLYFSRSGVQHRVMQLMRRGQIEISGELDLHGLTPDSAEEKLSKFLAYAQEREWRYVLVIHGKGVRGHSDKPVLKNKVNQWLRGYPQVLAFCSANPFQGGVGAVYVFLKKSHKNS